MKFLAIMLISALAVAQAQMGAWGPGGGGGFGPGAAGVSGFGFGFGYPPASIFQNIVLQAEAQKLLTEPGFPEDLQQRVQDTLANAQTGFDSCTTTATLPWLQIRCSVMQLQKSKNELKAIENEAKARAEAAAAATTAATVA